MSAADFLDRLLYDERDTEGPVRGTPQRGMCPQCGVDAAVIDSLIAPHGEYVPLSLSQPERCPGEGQYPRCAESDARPLWNGQPNGRFRG